MGIERALALLDPDAREEGEFAPDGYLDLIGGSGPPSTGLGQDLMLSPVVPRIYERFWGPRTDDVLKCALLTLLHRPDPTLAHVPLLLSDEAFRELPAVKVDAEMLDLALHVARRYTS